MKLTFALFPFFLYFINLKELKFHFYSFLYTIKAKNKYKNDPLKIHFLVFLSIWCAQLCNLFPLFKDYQL